MTDSQPVAVIFSFLYKILYKNDEPVYNMNLMEGFAMPTEKPRFTIVVDEDLFNKIEDFRYENRIASRSAATLELIRLGIEHLSKDDKNKNADNNSNSTTISDQRMEVISKCFEQLNDQGREQAYMQMRVLADIYFADECLEKKEIS
jgi:metal-responsive CopG/Arc/MetJ family transcriptional regulator